MPDPELGPDDVRIRVGGVGLCGSDTSVFSGRWPTPSLPWIMGHEAFGTIESVGSNVPTARLGETVVIEPNAVCLECAQCRRGITSACERRQSVGMNRPGALADLLVVPSSFAWPVTGLEPAALVCVEPLAVVQAALRRMPRALPAAALVVGAGPQGLLMCLTLLARGVRVQVVDVNPARAAFALGLGAEASPPAERFELVVDTVGSPEAHAGAVERAEVGGTVLVLGLDDRPLGLSARVLVRRQLELRGSLTYDHPHDFRATLDTLARDDMELTRIVTNEYALEDAQAAFEAGPLAAGKTWVRVVPGKRGDGRIQT